MSDQPARIEPQYLQAATQYASQLNTLVWHKMTLIFAVQSAIIIAAYFLRGSLLSWIVLALGGLFCAGLVTSIHYDLEGRTSLIAQANHISRELRRVPAEGIVMSLETYPSWSLRPHWTFWRIVILIAIDFFAAVCFNVPFVRELVQSWVDVPLLPPLPAR